MRELKILMWIGLAGASGALAGGFELKRGAVAGGGGVMTGSEFAVTGAVAQPSADQLAGSEFSLRAGVLAPALPAAPRPDLVFSNGFE